MDEFKQCKLCKTEWVSIEKPLDKNELIILDIIKNGYENHNISYNKYFTIGQYVKTDNDDGDYYIYIYIIRPILHTLYKKCNFDELTLKPPKKKINNADKIRLENNKNMVESIENIILDLYIKLSKTQKVLYYYNILYLLKQYTVNKHFKVLILKKIDMHKYTSIDILTNCNKLIENNKIFDYRPIELHKHQKDIYSIIKKNERALIFYTSPTSSGKTLTPIGLCRHYKVLFICASRHIGVNLAKSAINVGVKTGFAFGCESIDDIRLHYFSVNSYTNDKYKNPIHSDGSKLELLICDIHSYEYAMNYMISFNDTENIILFWDEPTISMDRDEHPLHNTLKKNWSINKIPRVILSSATLPLGLEPIVDEFKDKFDKSVFYKIEVTDNTTNIVLLDQFGQIIMPHNYFKTTETIKEFIKTKGDSYMKMLSVCDCANYILYSRFVDEFNTLEFDSINSYVIKKFYYKVVQEELNTSFTKTPYDNSVLFTTSSACSIKYGPALWIVNSIDTWSTYLLNQIKIKEALLEHLDKQIQYNSKLNDKINKLTNDYQDKIHKDEGNENKMTQQRFDPDVKLLLSTIEILEKSYKQIQLDPIYIPNTQEHYGRWTNRDDYIGSNVYKGNINELYVKRIMNTDVDFTYKVLLLLGIGIFHQSNIEFNDIMKELADSKQLMLIIATSDYIYGTNYQFAHAYLSEDLIDLTQEKLIQSIGRVGRKDKNKTFTFRFRDNNNISLLFDNIPSKEGIKMNELFS